MRSSLQTKTSLTNRTAGTVIRGDSLSSQDCLAHVSNFRDKVVLITGASSGFGRATALVAARHGAKLVLGDLNEAGVKKVVEEVKRNGGQAIARSCNVTSFESQRDLFEAGEKEFGWIDIVVPNAGVTEKLHPGFEDSVTDKAGRLQPPNLITLDVNLRGAVFTTHLALHYLRKRPDRTGKALVMIGSMASFFSIPSGPMYSVAKSGILGLMRSEYFTLNASGIRTAMVAPWYTETGALPLIVLEALLTRAQESSNRSLDLPSSVCLCPRSAMSSTPSSVLPLTLRKMVRFRALSSPRMWADLAQVVRSSSTRKASSLSPSKPASSATRPFTINSLNVPSRLFV